jgi:hypothetical protein
LTDTPDAIAIHVVEVATVEITAVETTGTHHRARTARRANASSSHDWTGPRPMVPLRNPPVPPP